MKLDLDKSEKTTLFGKTRYLIRARIFLTFEEAGLVKKQLNEGQIIDAAGIESVSAKAGVRLRRQRGHLLDGYTRSGFSFEFDSIQDRGNYEAALVNGCRHLERQIEASKSHVEPVEGPATLSP